MVKTFFVAAALLVLTGCAVRLPKDGGRKDLTQIEIMRQSADDLELACMERHRLEYCIRDQPSRKVCITSCCIMAEAVGNDHVDNQRVMTCVKNRS